MVTYLTDQARFSFCLAICMRHGPLLSIPDEGRYADISRHMFESGDWLVPRLDGLPFIHKPLCCTG